MSRIIESACKLCRREAVKLFLKGDRCFSDKCAFERRAYPPGQHGNQRRKLSEYALRFEEKQKLLSHYNIREAQLRRFVRMSKTGRVSDWVDKLIGLLESRVDNVLFRAGMAPSIPAARQLVGHGHVRVNGKRINISSALVKPNDKVSLSEKAYKGTLYMQAKQSPRLELPDFLLLEGGDEKVATLREIPHAHDIPFPFESGMIAEWFAARKA